MQTDLTGRALDEAAARAMGWDGTPENRDKLEWLRQRGTVVGVGWPEVGFMPRVDFPPTGPAPDCLRATSLSRLVVAVAAREAKA